MNDASYRLLEHTADMGIEACADTFASVLEAAAKGLVEMMFGDSPSDVQDIQALTVTAEDPVELMVAWLNEVVYWSDSKNMVPANFKVEMVNENELHAKIGGERFDMHRHRAERQVKSVTYHQASLELNDGRWLARVYVDL